VLWDAGGHYNYITHLLVHILPGSVKTIIATFPGCVKNNSKYFQDVPVQGDMNNEVGSGCVQRMWAGDENQ